MAAIVIRTFIIYFILMAMIRFSGKRQVGQLDISEFVLTVILSEIACLPIDDPDVPLLHAIVPIILIVCTEVIITFIKNKSSFLKRLFESECCILIDKGKIQPKALEKNRISVEELMGELRLKGAALIDDVYYAVIEHNGNISVILKSELQPLCPKDAGIDVKECGISHAIIVDGKINYTNLEYEHLDSKWLDAELASQNLSPSEIFLMSIDDNKKVFIARKEK